MKRSNKLKLFLASATLLSTSILVPTILTACSSTVDNPNDNGSKPDNNGNNNNDPLIPVVTMKERIAELQKPENELYRALIYSGYTTAINRTVTNISNQQRAVPPLGLPTYPQLGDFAMTLKLMDLVKKPEFINQFINMIDKGLEVGTGTNAISDEQKQNLIKEMNSCVSEMVQIGPTKNSNWGTYPFGFIDTGDSATWLFENSTNTITYKLFLTRDVKFDYQENNGKVSVSVTNKATANAPKVNASNPRVRLQVIKSPALGVDGTGTAKDIYFKPGVIELPNLLFGEFQEFLDKYNQNMDKIREFLTKSSNIYDKIADNGFAQNATLWNQFMLKDHSLVEHALSDDLSKNKDTSQLVQWLKKNSQKTAEGTTSAVDELVADLKAAETVSLTLSPIYIQGTSSNASGGGSNKIDIECHKPGTEAQAPEVITTYSIELYPILFGFTPQVNNFIGYSSASEIKTTPTLTFDAQSKIISHSNAEQPTTTLINSGQPIDVTSIFDMNEVGFSDYLFAISSNQVNNPINGLLEKQESKTNFIDLFKQYLVTPDTADKTPITELLKSSLSDLIFDNIDLTNMVSTTDADSGAEFNKIDSQLWKQNLNKWITSTAADAPAPNITTNNKSGSDLATTANIKISANGKNLDMPIIEQPATNNRANPNPKPKTKSFSNVYIYFGTNPNIESVVANSAINGRNTSSSLFINPKLAAKPELKAQDEAALLNGIKDKVWVVFEEAATKTGGTTTPGALYAFYMGQKNNTDGQETFPIIIPSALIDTIDFHNTFTGQTALLKKA